MPDATSVFFALDGSAVERGDGAAGELPDLDSAALWRPMCAPLQRTLAEDDEDERRFLPFAYAPPLGLDLRAFPYRPLRVERCGRERPLRLSRCRRACVAVHLGAGSIAWRERGRIRLYRGVSRRTSSGARARSAARRSRCPPAATWSSPPGATARIPSGACARLLDDQLHLLVAAPCTVQMIV